MEKNKMEKSKMKKCKMEKIVFVKKFLRHAAAVSLMGCAFLWGSAQVSAATMKDVFDEYYYADRYPDLKAAYGYDREELWQHYVNCGFGEGRLMNGLIDVVEYRNAYPDLNEQFGDDWDAYVNHYLNFGLQEGRYAGIETNKDLNNEQLQIKLGEILVRNSERQALELAQWLQSAKGQVLPKDSYGALWGLDQVDSPILRTREESILRLSELGMGNELIADISRNSSRYSDAMLAALANNPEMADFVSRFGGISAEASGGLTQEELALEFPLLLQWDPRWGYVQYGGNSCIGLAGCGPTCLSMVLYYLTGDASITPDNVAAYSMAHGHYVQGAGTAWRLLAELPPLYGVRVSEPANSEQTLKEALDQGKVVICSMRPGNFTAGGHFIVIYGYDQEGFKLNDPNCVARSAKRWTYGEFAAQIKHTWIFEKDAAAAVF